MKLKCLAHAKVNLYLDVVGKDNNGYHKVQSVIQTLILADEISFKEAPALKITSNDKSIPDSKNLVFKTAQALAMETGVKKGARIELHKNIPVAGGLGGGSADAAATLIGLNKIWNLNLSPLILRKIALKIGMDVPLFFEGGTLLVEGKGERLTPLPNLPQASVVIAKPSFGISTKEAYKELDKSKVPPFFRLSSILKAIRRKDLKEVGQNLNNIFEKIAFKNFPLIKRLKSLALKEGALGALMTGTGSSLFVLVKEESLAQKIAQILQASGALAILTKPSPKGVELFYEG